MLEYENETEMILKACMNVHNELGSGFLEPVYQSALAVEFKMLGIPYEQEKKINVFYKGVKLDREYYADFICYGKIIVELKAVFQIVKAHKAQVLNYLSATKSKIGLLVNFGENSLKWQRISNLHEKETALAGSNPRGNKMKDSGIDFFDKIPSTWESKKIKYLFRLVTELNHLPMDEVQLLSLYTDLGVFPHGEQEERGNKAVTVE